MQTTISAATGSHRQPQTFTAEALVQGMVGSAALIFLLSLGSGLWAAYDRWLALPRFCLLTATFVGMSGWVWCSGRRHSPSFVWMATACTFLAGGIGLCFLAIHDWQVAFGHDFQALYGVTAWLQQHRPALPVLREKGTWWLHENAVAGALIGLLPISGAGLYHQWRSGRFSRVLIESSLVGVALVALLLTFSRGAWLGLGLALSIVSITVNGRYQPLTYRLAFVGGVLLMGTAVMTFLLAPKPLLAVMQLAIGSGSSVASSRLTIWQDAVALVDDYWFTGSGLQSTPMVLSSYVYLLHVPYLAHGHNYYLQLALEQGVPGLLAYVLLTAGLLWRSTHLFKEANHRQRIVVIGATTGLLAVLSHGWFDAELYSSVLAPVSFLPLAILGAADTAENQTSSAVDKPKFWLVGALLPLLLISMVAGASGLAGRYWVNRAAVAQSRLELGIYQWPTWPIQDAVRRHFPEDMAVIKAFYVQALRRQPTNAAAHRRLGQILLSQAQVDVARHHLEAAYGLAPQQRATRQLLGEAYALAGDIVGAQRLWHTIDVGEDQLTMRVGWYTQQRYGQPSWNLAKAVRTMMRTTE